MGTEFIGFKYPIFECLTQTKPTTGTSSGTGRIGGPGSIPPSKTSPVIDREGPQGSRKRVVVSRSALHLLVSRP